MPSWQPKKYMKTAVRFGLENGSFGLLLDPGLGKTAITLAIAQILREEEIVKRVLVVAPLRPAYETWPQQAEYWDEFADLKVRVLHGPKKEALLDEPHDVSIINPEGLEWLLGWTDDEGARHTGAIDERDWYWDMLVIDESSKFKHADTVRFRTLKPCIRRFKRRAILTGSPVPNGLLDLFGQIYILDMGQHLGQYITHYREKYFRPTGFGGYTWIPKKGSDKKIYKAIAPLTLRMSAADHLDLPPLLSNIIRVNLPDQARRVYNEMEALMLAAVEDETIVAANAAAATVKCRQIANGGIYREDGETWKHIHDVKTDALVDLVDELNGRPLFVAYEFKHDLDRIRRKLGAEVPYIAGGVPPKKMAEIIKRWNAGELRVLLAQPQSVAHGLNLQGVAAHVCRYGNTWDLEVDEQFVRRVWRQGQKETVIDHRIIARGTVDEVILQTLARKDKTQKALLSALRDYSAGRRISAIIPKLKGKRGLGGERLLAAAAKHKRR